MSPAIQERERWRVDEDRFEAEHMLPVKAEIRRAIGKEQGDGVTVHLKERIRGR
jgi:Domain of unknown function (DUF1905)